MTKPVVTMNNISYAYEQKLVLNNVNFEIPLGSFMRLVGPNGGGKTTLIKLLLGLLKPDAGAIQLFGQPIEKDKQRKKIGFVSQKSNAFNKGDPATVYAVVPIGLAVEAEYLK